jgi:hypothetical protein
MLDTINRETIERWWTTFKLGVADTLRNVRRAERRPTSPSPSRAAPPRQDWGPSSDRPSWMMQEPKWFAASLVFGFLAIAEILSWAASTWPVCLLASKYQPAGNQTGPEACASLSEGIIRFVGFLWDRTDANAVIGIAAVVVVIFAWMLWRSSEKMWNVTNAAAEAAKRSADALVVAEQAQLLAVFGVSNVAHVLSELGAYVPATPDATSLKERVYVQYVLKNYGRTPAVLKEISHDLLHLARLPDEPKYVPIPAMPKEVAIVAGASSESLQVNLTVPLTVEAAASIRTGDSHLWLYGRVVYDDAFGREREHRFLYRYRIGPGFQAYRQGDWNKST